MRLPSFFRSQKACAVWAAKPLNYDFLFYIRRIKMLNPGSIMKLMSAKKKFTDNHPKFMAFLERVFSMGVTEGTVIEITVTRPGEEPVTTNMKVKQSDLELMRELEELAQ